MTSDPFAARDSSNSLLGCAPVALAGARPPHMVRGTISGLVVDEGPAEGRKE